MLLDVLSIPAAESTCGQQAVHIASTQGLPRDECIGDHITDELRGMSANESFAFGMMCVETRRIPKKLAWPT